jgi:hypothetical protein
MIIDYVNTCANTSNSNVHSRSKCTFNRSKNTGVLLIQILITKIKWVINLIVSYHFKWIHVFLKISCIFTLILKINSSIQFHASNLSCQSYILTVNLCYKADNHYMCDNLLYSILIYMCCLSLSTLVLIFEAITQYLLYVMMRDHF